MPSDPEPWYRSTAATVAAGIASIVVVVGLVVAVVQMSSQWGRGETPVLPAPASSSLTTTTSPAGIITPSTTTSYSVPSVSTTEIGGDASVADPSATPLPEASTTTATSEADEASGAGADATDETTTTRRTPRTNITRTVFPQP